MNDSLAKYPAEQQLPAQTQTGKGRMNAHQDDDERYLHDDYQRKQVRIRPPQSVANVLSQLLARRGYAHVQTAAACDAAWQQAAGPRFAKDSRPGNVRRGVLEVVVRNSAVLQELTFMKVQVVKKLAQLAPEQKIRDVKFRVGAID